MGFYLFAHQVVGNTNHLHIGNRLEAAVASLSSVSSFLCPLYLVRVECILYFGRVDIFSSSDQHVFEPSNNPVP
jgi:hypothetical protein